MSGDRPAGAGTARHAAAVGRAGSVAILAALALAVSAAGCGEEIVFPDDRTPFVYLVLNHTVGLTGEPIQPAFVLTVWSADSVSYRSAERFEMRRASDDALFDWRNASIVTASPTFDLGQAVRPSRANYLLASDATEGFFEDTTERGLRHEDLQPGATYELLVDTGEEVIRGRATIPDTFRFSFPGGRRIVWSRVEGAKGYRVELTDDDVFFVRDTSFTVPEDITSGRVVLHALGPHVYDYLTDDRRRRAGIDTGSGVFGAIMEGRRPVDGNAARRADDPRADTPSGG